MRNKGKTHFIFSAWQANFLSVWWNGNFSFLKWVLVHEVLGDSAAVFAIILLEIQNSAPCSWNPKAFWSWALCSNQCGQRHCRGGCPVAVPCPWEHPAPRAVSQPSLALTGGNLATHQAGKRRTFQTSVTHRELIKAWWIWFQEVAEKLYWQPVTPRGACLFCREPKSQFCSKHLELHTNAAFQAHWETQHRKLAEQQTGSQCSTSRNTLGLLL